ncbi:MAG TPA: thioredoxin family protein [Thermoanaerobaculia bacterium]|nr:thioredoxin family protein [Thermoanaerobaculia bacterium]
MQIPCLFVFLALAAAPVLEAQIQAPKKASFVLSANRTAYEAGGPAKVAALVTIDPGWHVNSHKPTFEYLIPTVLDLELPEGWPRETVQYPPGEMQTFSFEKQPLAVYDGSVVFLANLAVPAGTTEGTYPVRASLRFQACNDSQCLPPVTAEAEIQLTVGPGGKPQNSDLFTKSAAVAAPPVPGGEDVPAPAVEPAADEEKAAAAPASPGGKGPRGGLAGILLLAVLGGLILNAMPCVLPVLSLKVFGLVRSAGHGRAEVTRGALATSAGILASFLTLALAAVAARAAGAAVGWGVQFQRPGFVAFLAVIVILFCLNLWGLFEIPLPQRLARLGGTGPREGAAGHFFSGLFATLMATPCSAPFLGTAISFALSQSSPVVFAVFMALGLGMALPYLLIAVAPGIARLLPRPGAWMETVRGVMGFLLAASAVWLFYVLSSQVAPEKLAAIQLGLLGIALFTWIGHRIARSRAFRGVAAAGVLAAVAVTLFTAAGNPGQATSGPRTAAKSAGHIDWVEFDRSRAESLASDGQLVFVDVTADWCFTCKINEKLILDTPEVAGAFEEHGVIPMKADWTNRSDTIAKFLAEHGRYGIPFYLLYRPGQDPHVFGELPSKDGLVEVVREAADGRPIAQR